MSATTREAPRIWRGAPPEATVRRILRVHGYKDPSTVRRPILRAAEAAAQAARQVADPCAVWLECEVAAVEEDRLLLAGGTCFTGAAFGRVLADAGAVAIFVLTLGAEFDAAIASRMEENPVEALFLDTAGWLSVEGATRDLAREIDRCLGPGRRAGPRLGPGYDYRAQEGRQRWPLEEQRALFSLFGEADLPVRLLESCAMMPKMSRSGLFGLVPAGPADETTENAKENEEDR